MVIFQPHTYSRTRALAADFAAALSEADEVVLAAIYASRETDTLGVTSAAIADEMPLRPVMAEDSQDAVELARARLRRGDVVLVMGAGDITAAATLLAKQGAGT
jgi:UDP-N-acetylmuramate--alanine ligase